VSFFFVNEMLGGLVSVFFGSKVITYLMYLSAFKSMLSKIYAG